MGRWIKRHKGLFIFLCIFTTLVLMFVGVIACSVNMSKKYLDALMTNETAVVERRDLVESISASGYVVSSDSVIVTARVANVDIIDINVELGDWVEAGDLICSLDSTNLEESLAIAQANLEANEQSLAMAVSAAQRQYNDALDSQNQANENAQDMVDSTLRAFELAILSRDAALNAYNAIVVDAAAIINLNNDIAAINNNAALSDEEKASQISVKNNEKNSHIEAVNKYYSYGYVDFNDNSSVQSFIDKNKDTAYSTYISAQYNYINAQNTYNNAVDAAATPSGSSMVSNAYDNLTNAQTNAEIGTMSAEQQIDQYQQQIENCTVYAPISGMVTSVNFREGDLYTGAAIVTIENTSTYDVETYISEYDIGKVKVGQEVVVKTNGTGDLELEGVVKSVAPRSTPGANGVVYKVIVQINTPCEDIRLDMTAKLSIIMNKAENVITVPYESVQYEEDGRAYVEISKGKNASTGLEEKEKVYVTTGVESAYYIEITSGDITEGSEVIVPRDEYNALNIYELLEEEGALGGY